VHDDIDTAELIAYRGDHTHATFGRRDISRHEAIIGDVTRRPPSGGEHDRPGYPQSCRDCLTNPFAGASDERTLARKLPIVTHRSTAQPDHTLDMLPFSPYYLPDRVRMLTTPRVGDALYVRAL
jgi:hypothetical protein